MTWIRSSVGALALLGLMGLAWASREPSRSFANLQDVQARLLRAGFACTPDNRYGHIATGFLVSRERLTWRDVSTLCKIGAMGPQWQGKVWVTVNTPLWQLETLPEQAGLRGWGDILAFGDQELLQEVDNVLQ